MDLKRQDILTNNITTHYKITNPPLVKMGDFLYLSGNERLNKIYRIIT